MQPMVGSIRVANLTTKQVAFTIAESLRNVVVAPLVSVWVTKSPPIHVNVMGEVKTPGRFEMTRDRTLPAALAQAGWVTEFAHADRIFVIRSSSAERVRFRVRDIVAAEPHTTQFQLNDADVIVVE
jgi:polysaccharide biosynthesis/export protein